MRQLYKDHIKQLPYLALFLTLLVWHFPMSNFGDDHYFMQAALNSNWVEFFNMRYQTWSSRIILEFLTLINFTMPIWVWKLLNCSMLMLICYSMDKILNRKKDLWQTGITALLVLIYPIFHMATAGWLTTSINYLWPAALGLYSLTILLDMCKFNEPMSWWQILSGLLALVVACNHEMLCIILLFCVTAMIASNSKNINKKVPITYLTVIILSLMLIKSSPAVSIRMQSEITTWFPGFSQLSLIEKGAIGLSATLKHYLGLPNVLLIVLLLGLTLKAREKGQFVKTAYSIDLAVLCFNGYGIWRLAYQAFEPREAKFYQVIDRLYGIKEITLQTDLLNMHYWTELGVMGLVFAGIAFLVIKLSNTKREGVILLGILVITFGSRVAMGLSPTIYASSLRTFLFPYLGLMVVSLYFLATLPVVLKSKVKGGLYWLLWFGVAATNFATILLVEYIKR